MSATQGEPGRQGSLWVRVQGLSPSPVCPQSERDELNEDGEGSIRSSEEAPGDSGEWRWGPEDQEVGTRGREWSPGRATPCSLMPLMPWHL